MQRFYPTRLTLLVIKAVILAGISFAALVGCTTAPPPDSHDICAVFQEYPRWYWESLDSYNQWGVPISVQMAIIRQESHFRADARPPRTKLLGMIPWTRPTTAYGYAQAVDGTWEHYKQETHNVNANRDAFGDAVDFIGWYSNKASKKLGISKRNAYELYLAYHEGINGYANGSYKNQAWLIQVARNVQTTANRYRNQLTYCYKNIPKPSVWNLWGH